jgi:hypothetical protein
MTDVIERAKPFLQQCASCDYGLPMSCTCPAKDFRPVMLELVREVERLREEALDAKNPRYRVKSGNHEGRIGRRVKIDIRAHPLNRRAHVYTIEFPEGDSVRLWEWAVEKQ